MARHRAKTIERTWHCKLCKTEVPKGVAPKTHKKTHAKCETCLTECRNQAAMVAHQRKTGHCYCPGCDEHFRDREAHVGHLRAVRAADERHHKQDALALGKDPGLDGPAKRRGHGDHGCEKCGRDYPDAAILRYHCCDCDKVYRGTAGLTQHLATDSKHIGNLSAEERAAIMRRHTCPVCLEAFQKLKELRRHIRSDHAVVACPLAHLGCKEKFSTPQDMVSHWRRRWCVDILYSADAYALAGQSRNALGADVQMEDQTGQDDDASQRWVVGLFEEAMRQKQDVDSIADIIQKLQLQPLDEADNLELDGQEHNPSVVDSNSGIRRDPQSEIIGCDRLIARAKALQRRIGRPS